MAGPLIGSVFFVILRDELVKNFQGVHLFIFGSLFILVVLLLPGGLIEVWQRIKKRIGLGS